jgi:NAD(P)-dependent dehydrogenase (short-subunit alcohol dehydrogenase family)
MHTLSRRYPQKRAFVTGAASGFGEAICLRLATDGWHLVMVDKSDRLETTAGVVEAAGAKVTAITLDVTKRDDYEDVVKQVSADLGGMDMVFNNAGVAATGEVGHSPLDDWEWVLDINLRGVLYGCHLWSPVLKAQGSGHITNTASMAALMPIPGMGAYCVSKSAVRVLSDVMWGELEHHGVDVSVVMPEFFQTNLADTARGDKFAAQSKLERSGRSADEVAEYVLSHMARRRLHILYPKSMKSVWLIKRLMPARILKTVRQQAARQKANLDKHRPADDPGASGEAKT